MDHVTAHSRARIAGALWLGVFVAGFFAVTTIEKVYVSRNPAETFARLTVAQTAVRLGIVGNLASGALYVGVTVLLYNLLSPVSKRLSLLALLFALTGSAVGAVNSVALLMAVTIVDAANVMTFATSQIESLTYLAIGAYRQGFYVGMTFFGLQCFTAGYLITRSGYLPRVLGGLLAFGGASYVVSSFLSISWPFIGAAVSRLVLPTVFLGEGSLCLWLLFKGVDRPAWNARGTRLDPISESIRPTFSR